MASPQILIADDHGIVRLGTSMLIKEMYPAAVIKETANFKATLQQLEQQHFDLLLLDINMPGGDDIRMIANIRLRQPDIPILILSSYDQEAYAMLYLKAGANGYLQKESGQEEIKAAIHKVIHKEMYVSNLVQQQLFRNISSARKDAGLNPLSELSGREMELMRLFAKGLSSTEIKNKLNIQLSTISTHKANIFQKMGVTNVVDLAEKLKRIETGK